MNYETVVTHLFERFPKLRSIYDTEFEYTGNEKPGPYMVFGSILVPALKDALAIGELSTIVPICAFLEDVAESSKKDAGLGTLLIVEIGEWLGRVENEASLTPWLGAETKRICRYVPGLATQRIALQKARNERSLKNRIRSFIKRLRGN